MPGFCWRDIGHKALCPISTIPVHVQYVEFTLWSTQNSVYTEYNYVNQGINSHIIVFELIRVFTAELRDCNPGIQQIRAYSAYRVTWLRAAANTRDSEGRLLTSPACWEKSPAEAHEGTRLQLDPFLTCSRGASILKWVRLEFRLIMHEMNRVTQKFWNSCMLSTDS